MSQTEDIRDHLERYGRISPLVALREYGCFRLAARIAELRAKGMDIETLTSPEGYAVYVHDQEPPRIAIPAALIVPMLMAMEPEPDPSLSANPRNITPLRGNAAPPLRENEQRAIWGDR